MKCTHCQSRHVVKSYETVHKLLPVLTFSDQELLTDYMSRSLQRQFGVAVTQEGVECNSETCKGAKRSFFKTSFLGSKLAPVLFFEVPREEVSNPLQDVRGIVAPFTVDMSANVKHCDTDDKLVPGTGEATYLLQAAVRKCGLETDSGHVTTVLLTKRLNYANDSDVKHLDAVPLADEVAKSTLYMYVLRSLADPLVGDVVASPEVCVSALTPLVHQCKHN